MNKNTTTTNASSTSRGLELEDSSQTSLIHLLDIFKLEKGVIAPLTIVTSIVHKNSFVKDHDSTTGIAGSSNANLLVIPSSTSGILPS